jgi:hypothetical protein
VSFPLKRVLRPSLERSFLCIHRKSILSSEDTGHRKEREQTGLSKSLLPYFNTMKSYFSWWSTSLSNSIRNTQVYLLLWVFMSLWSLISCKTYI